jgi:YesN/AraC family two-component response regulator
MLFLWGWFTLENIYKEIELTMAKNRFTTYTHPPYELEKRLMSAIKELNYDKSLDILNQINSLERAKLSKLALNSLKYSLVGSCTLFTRAVIEAGLDAETAFMLSDYYINLIDTNSGKGELSALEYKMLNDFIRILSTHKEYIYNPLINRVMSYIKRNIENNLHLQDIADFANIHPNYLSAIFKKEVGKTLNRYVNEQKIHSIKLYLDHTNLSISEISGIFSFNHITYFSLFFKKHTGLTPLGYRNRH